jgi:xanthine dehydrogenase molybdenum-binding subunit
MAEDFSYVGKRLTRPDVAAKATGTAIYGADLVLPGMLFGRILMSPHPHANIARIDTSRAKALAGVAAVITHEDVPKLPFTRSAMAEGFPAVVYEGENRDQFILSDKARYVGDWIAAVAAVDIYTAERALDLIDVEYEVLSAVFDPEEALKPGAPVVHDRWPGNVAGDFEHPFNKGDIEEALANSAHVVEFSGRTSRQKQAHLEPDVALASWDEQGRLTVWSPCQNAHLAKKAMARRVFGIGEGDIRWVTTTVGGGFGARMSFGVEPVCAMLSRVTGKPVKVLVTREEDFAGWNSRTEQRQTITLGVSENGELTAIRQTILSDAGAYLSHSGSISAVNMQATLGLLRSPVVYGKATVAYTNNPTSSGMRGYGNPEGQFILQQAIDMAAEKVGMDPVEFRLMNAKGCGEPSMWEPVALDSCALDRCIVEGARKLGWDEKWLGWGTKKEGRYRRGVGMSIMTHASGAGGFLLEHSNAILKLHEDGSAQLTVSPCEMGQGILGVLTQIAAEASGLRYEDIHVITGDTDVTLFDIGSHASRSTYVVGNAVVDAGMKVKALLVERAAQKLALAPSDLEVRQGEVYAKDDPDRRVTVADISHDAIYDYGSEGRHITATGTYQSLTHAPNFQAGFAEIEVDTETGVIKVLRLVLAHDIGRAINPQNVEGCLEGGACQGLGYALWEDLEIDPQTGRVLTDSFATYKIPSALDVPEIELILVEDPAPTGPFGAKGVGEPGMNNIAGAVANALYDAVGVRVHSVPITAEKVLEAMKDSAIPVP